MQQEAANKRFLADRLEMTARGEPVPEAKPKRGNFSAEGLERCRQAAKDQWVPCPKCGVKHRHSHPHIQRLAKKNDPIPMKRHIA